MDPNHYDVSPTIHKPYPAGKATASANEPRTSYDPPPKPVVATGNSGVKPISARNTSGAGLPEQAAALAKLRADSRRAVGRGAAPPPANKARGSKK